MLTVTMRTTLESKHEKADETNRPHTAIKFRNSLLTTRLACISQSKRWYSALPNPRNRENPEEVYIDYLGPKTGPEAAKLPKKRRTSSTSTLNPPTGQEVSIHVFRP